jgi:hypothetical protein
MVLLIVGTVVFVLTGIAFWYCLPSDGKTHRFVGTEWEPYVGVAFCAAVALALTMMLSGAINLASGSSGDKPKASVDAIHHLAKADGYRLQVRL